MYELSKLVALEVEYPPNFVDVEWINISDGFYKEFNMRTIERTYSGLIIAVVPVEFWDRLCKFFGDNCKKKQLYLYASEDRDLKRKLGEPN